MPVKTKKELLEEIEQKNEELKSLKSEVKKLENYRKYDDCANEIRTVYQSFVNSGFTEEQAFEILTITLNNQTKKTIFG